MAEPAAAARPARVWDLVCRHIDGVVIGTTMAALEQRGALKILAAQERTGFGELRRELAARAGYLNVALRLLADQGWLTCSGEPGTDDLVVAPTPAGQQVMTELAPAYATAAGFLPLASQIDKAIFGGPVSGGPVSGGPVSGGPVSGGPVSGAPVSGGPVSGAPVSGGPAVGAPVRGAPVRGAPVSGGGAPSAVRNLGVFADLMRREWGLPGRGGQARRQVLAHLDGHLVAPVMFALTRRGALAAGASVRLDGPGLRHAIEIVAEQGWARIDGDRASLTAEGEVAVALARQYRYPMVYLPLLRRVPDLLFGADRPAADDPGGVETHLDRELDISFSGDVFAAVCRTPFLEIALPLFNREPLGDQPALVVDTGCGDGAMLAALYEAVLTRTARGRRIAEFPLLMVGADPSQVARQVAAARLAAAGIPHLIMDGDIADPDRLTRALADRGLDARDALHVCKSAIHDRSYYPPGSAAGPVPPASPGSVPRAPAVPPVSSAPPVSSVPPASSGAFAQPDGSAIAATQLALNLAEFFRDWRQVTRKHGWIVIEAHAAPAATVAALIGRTVATALDATHGYSCQYPVEPAVFAWAAQVAGFRSRAHAEPAASALGHTILTVDHFVPGTAQTR